MTQEESTRITKQIIRKAKSGKEIADAICAHFAQFKGSPCTQRAPYSDALDLLNTPLFGSNLESR